MNYKRFISAVVALFMLLFAYETVVHGFLLKGIYLETPSIWRHYKEMIGYQPFNIAVMALTSIWLVFIFSCLFKEGGWKNGLKFGLYIGLLSGIQAAGAWYYLPISALLAGYWFLGYLIQSVIGGLIIGLIYRP